ncbi:MAG: hypothetical protein GY940_30625, partial [bacterium]|nr:hypothetical protein [bacterium]
HTGRDHRVLGQNRGKEAIVLPWKNEMGHPYLCAYICPEDRLFDETTAIFPELKKYLSISLPGYMIPLYFIALDKIPLTPGGRVDTGALPNPPAARDHDTPRNRVEEKIAACWRQVLKLNKIGFNENFFQLGGNSLEFLELAAEISREYSMEISLQEIIKSPCIKDIANIVLDKSFTFYNQERMLVINPGRGRQIFGFPPGIGYGFVYSQLVDVLHDYTIYGLEFIESRGRNRQYVDLIKKYHCKGPCILFAYCIGGELALEITALLEQEGVGVSDIVFVECYRAARIRGNAWKNEFMGIINRDIKKKGLLSLGVKIMEKVGRYLDYYNQLKKLEKVKANIHLIAAPHRFSQNPGEDRL